MTHIKIPEQLIKAGFRFIKLKPRDKVPVEPDWPYRNNYFAWDLQLIDWIEAGGNYGVIGDKKHVIVDIDSEEAKKCAEKLPPTFTVQSPGSKGWHLYYLCDLDKPIRLRNKDGKNIGDIQGIGKQVVGPNCIHPNGGRYKVIKPLPVAKITKEQLIEAFKEYIVRMPTKEEIKKEYREQNVDVDIPIEEVAMPDNARRSGDEIYGAHPVHGSTTGRNFWINPKENVWYCFRCNAGGGPLEWLAVKHGLIDCSEAGAGCLRGELFKKVLEIARREGYKVNITNKARKERETKKEEKEERLEEEITIIKERLELNTTIKIKIF